MKRQRIHLSSLRAIGLTVCATLSLSLAGAWSGHARQNEPELPQMGPAANGGETVETWQPNQSDSASQPVPGGESDPILSRKQAIQRRIEQKLAMARAAVAAAEAAGTRELTPEDLQDGRLDGSSAEEKLARLSSLSPSAINGTPGTLEGSVAEDQASNAKSTSLRTDHGTPSLPMSGPRAVMEQSPTDAEIAAAMEAYDEIPPTNCVMNDSPIPFAGSA